MGMKCKCKKPTIIKNKFVSTCVGGLSIYMGLTPMMMIGTLSVYITSYIHYHQDFVTMHYGYFFNLILDISSTFSTAIGGILAPKIGFNFTTLLGNIICLVANIFFFRVQNIWFCYILIFIIGIGFGIATSLLLRNATLYIPNKKAFVLSILTLIVSLISIAYNLAGEKIIALDGQTLEDEEFYSEDIADRTYLAFMISFFTIPLGIILFLLFNYEYQEEKKPKVENVQISQDDKGNEDSDDKKEENNNDKEDESINDIKDDNSNDKKEENSNDKKEENSYYNKDAFTINESEDETKEKNDDKSDEKSNDEEDSQLNYNVLEEIQKTDEYMKKKIKKVLKTWRFWRIALTNFLISFPQTLMDNTGRTFGALIGIDGGALQYLMSSQIIILVIFGPIFGIISDKKGPILILRISMIFCAIGTTTLFFFTENTVGFMLSFIITSIGSTGLSVSYDPLLMDIYGIRESVILGSVNGCAGIVAEIITTVLAFVIPFFYSDKELITPYKIFFITGTVLNAIGFVVFLFEKNEKFEYKVDTTSLLKTV